MVIEDKGAKTVDEAIPSFVRAGTDIVDTGGINAISARHDALRYDGTAAANRNRHDNRMRDWRKSESIFWELRCRAPVNVITFETGNTVIANARIARSLEDKEASTRRADSESHSGIEELILDQLCNNTASRDVLPCARVVKNQDNVEPSEDTNVCTSDHRRVPNAAKSNLGCQVSAVKDCSFGLRPAGPAKLTYGLFYEFVMSAWRGDRNSNLGRLFKNDVILGGEDPIHTAPRSNVTSKRAPVYQRVFLDFEILGQDQLNYMGPDVIHFLRVVPNGFVMLFSSKQLAMAILTNAYHFTLAAITIITPNYVPVAFGLGEGLYLQIFPVILSWIHFISEDISASFFNQGNWALGTWKNKKVIVTKGTLADTMACSAGSGYQETPHMDGKRANVTVPGYLTPEPMPLFVRMAAGDAQTPWTSSGAHVIDRLVTKFACVTMFCIVNRAHKMGLLAGRWMHRSGLSHARNAQKVREYAFRAQFDDHDWERGTPELEIALWGDAR
ncbi:hypothetical protein EDB85DRAFT_1889460 [Lactarius pseudohatsudake]|nr:hypothetical protein EDB85DRAFT_1889460 [Lactarius pseudohatsudake]